jgi:hypothetical protein
MTGPDEERLASDRAELEGIKDLSDDLEESGAPITQLVKIAAQESALAIAEVREKYLRCI